MPLSTNSKAKGKQPAKAPAKAAEKASDEVFLLTLLKDIKVDHGAAAAALGIKEPASRMRYIRLQQKYGFKAVGHRPKKEAPANNADVTEGGANEQAAEDQNRDE
ncbi:hypothetical protein N7497_005791 [Penicillium chrysogenum]|uniref:Myb-like DNA-binding domain-containing protein n=1 Tax=Penicillium chrysogenum TaxID=5076 RepID=A0ABQ8WR74_PENCH|nr:hypothetical protein N7505_003722 [Penicillium chrysogenum]KAJ5285670.1 hypothetical protein N7524_000976 [Penicillium chrysogenum]KAJ6156906.1 hypothetical protein N7497_005791 [Penicillium chrysogenum]